MSLIKVVHKVQFRGTGYHLQLDWSKIEGDMPQKPQKIEDNNFY